MPAAMLRLARPVATRFSVTTRTMATKEVATITAKEQAQIGALLPSWHLPSCVCGIQFFLHIDCHGHTMTGLAYTSAAITQWIATCT